MNLHQIKHRFTITGIFLAIFICAFSSFAKADTLDNFQFYRQKELLVAGHMGYQWHYELSTNVKQIIVHPTDTFSFRFHHCTNRLNMVQYLMLRDSTQKDIWQFDSKYDGPYIMITGATLIAKMKERNMQHATLQFCFAEKENKPIMHTVEPDGSHVYYSDPPPIYDMLFQLTITIADN